MGKVKEKQVLIDAVIADLKKDFEAGDYTVLEELLFMIPNENLIHSLPEEDWKEYENVKENVHENVQNDNDYFLGIETYDPRNFSDEEVREFKEKWGQSHGELCAELGYDEVDTSELIMIDFFWIEADKKWYNIAASMYTDREQEIANYLRLGK